jgi:hypothetical protein
LDAFWTAQQIRDAPSFRTVALIAITLPLEHSSQPASQVFWRELAPNSPNAPYIFIQAVRLPLSNLFFCPKAAATGRQPVGERGIRQRRLGGSGAPTNPDTVPAKFSAKNAAELEMTRI